VSFAALISSETTTSFSSKTARAFLQETQPLRIYAQSILIFSPSLAAKIQCFTDLFFIFPEKKNLRKPLTSFIGVSNF
jgi:hypothetical protein